MSETTIGGKVQAGYKNKEIKTVSGQFIVPPNVFRLKVGAQGAGASGWSTSGSNPLNGGAGGNAGQYVAVELDVRPGDILSYTIGAGGIGLTGNNGQNGGATIVRLGTKPVCFAYGGVANSGGSAVNPPQYGVFGVAISANTEAVEGGIGGGAGLGGQAASSSMRCIGRYNDFAGPGVIAVGIDVGAGAPGGAASGSVQGGGGGGTSVFGVGGVGGNANNVGGDAPANNYGAGGGGGAGTSTNDLGRFKGGKGANGCVEIWF